MAMSLVSNLTNHKGAVHSDWSTGLGIPTHVSGRQQTSGLGFYVV